MQDRLPPPSHNTDFQAFYSWLLAQDISPTTGRHYRAAIKRIIQVMMNNDTISSLTPKLIEWTISDTFVDSRQGIGRAAWKHFVIWWREANPAQPPLPTLPVTGGRNAQGRPSRFTEMAVVALSDMLVLPPQQMSTIRWRHFGWNGEGKIAVYVPGEPEIILTPVQSDCLLRIQAFIWDTRVPAANVLIRDTLTGARTEIEDPPNQMPTRDDPKGYRALQIESMQTLKLLPPAPLPPTPLELLKMRVDQEREARERAYAQSAGEAPRNPIPIFPAASPVAVSQPTSSSINSLSDREQRMIHKLEEGATPEEIKDMMEGRGKWAFEDGPLPDCFEFTARASTKPE